MSSRCFDPSTTSIDRVGIERNEGNESTPEQHREMNPLRTSSCPRTAPTGAGPIAYHRCFTPKNYAYRAPQLASALA
jgi:hypothetical protein